MNPFSRFLAHDDPDAALRAFVSDWDRLESLIIRVYRQGHAASRDHREWRRLRPGLRRAHGRWRAPLDCHWPETRVAGQPAGEDPFLALLTPTRAEAFVDNWPAMQTLPAAREALNRLLVSRREETARD